MRSKYVSKLLFLISGVLFFSCHSKQEVETKQSPTTGPYFVVLGTLQDAGSPQAGCKKKCCEHLFSEPDRTRKVVSLGLIDPQTQTRYLFEAGPDFKTQLYELDHKTGWKNKTPWPDGIFITHAHIGHYTGLLHLGKEAMDAKSCKVYVLPRMKTFFETNAPWSQLCNTGNILLNTLKADSAITLGDKLSVIALQVPHRDEFSETAGFLIQGPNKSLLFIPDIDKWQKWKVSIVELIREVDYALLDGTFFSADEIKNRNLSEIPHPLVTESMELFKTLEPRDKNKIHFIHFNHTNPLLDSLSSEYKVVEQNGFRVARYKHVFTL